MYRSRVLSLYLKLSSQKKTTMALSSILKEGGERGVATKASKTNRISETLALWGEDTAQCAEQGSPSEHRHEYEVK